LGYLIAEELFELSVNVGVKRGVILLQRAINFIEMGNPLDTDGVLGYKTLERISHYQKNHREARILVKVINALQFMFYYNLVKRRPSLKIFAKGWMKRVNLSAD
jgi:lysozyme family protein